MCVRVHESTKLHTPQAGELYLSVEMVKEALDMFMTGEAWEKARDIARNIAPR